MFRGESIVMKFTRDYISPEDAVMLNQLEIYDYDKKIIRKWKANDSWLIEQEQKIYFVHVGGSGNLEQAPQQYDLIWKGRKIVIFKDNYSSYDNWNLLGIYAPIEFKSVEATLIELIEIVLNENHRIDIRRSEIIYNTEKFTVNNLNICYRDEVK